MGDNNCICIAFRTSRTPHRKATVTSASSSGHLPCHQGGIGPFSAQRSALGPNGVSLLCPTLGSPGTKALCPLRLTHPFTIGSFNGEATQPTIIPLSRTRLFPTQTSTTNWRVRIYIRMEQNSRKIVKRLKNDGFQLVSVRGSHHKFRRAQTTAIVPQPKRDLPVGAAKAIATQAGWLKETDK